MLQRLNSHLLWDVGLNANALDSIFPLCSQVQTSLLSFIGVLEELRLEECQCRFYLSELLASRAQKLRRIHVGDQEFDLHALARSEHLYFKNLNEPQALILAPQLRHMVKLHQVTLRNHVLWVPQSRLIDHQPRLILRDAVECLLLAGLLRSSPLSSRWLCWRTRSNQLEVAFRFCCPIPEKRWMQCFRVAERRCGVRIYTYDLYKDTERSERALCTFFIVGLLFFVILLRIFEDDFARSQGYPGVLLASHPLKAMTFKERSLAPLLE